MQREIQRLESRLSSNSPQGSVTSQNIPADITPSPVQEPSPRAIQGSLPEYHEVPESGPEGASLDGLVLPADTISALFALYVLLFESNITPTVLIEEQVLCALQSRSAYPRSDISRAIL